MRKIKIIQIEIEDGEAFALDESGDVYTSEWNGKTFERRWVLWIPNDRERKMIA